MYALQLLFQKIKVFLKIFLGHGFIFFDIIEETFQNPLPKNRLRRLI